MLYNPFDSIQPMGSFLDTMPFSELSVAMIARGNSGGSNRSGAVSGGVGGGIISGGITGGGGSGVGGNGVVQPITAASTTPPDPENSARRLLDEQSSNLSPDMATLSSNDAFRAMVRLDLSARSDSDDHNGNDNDGGCGGGGNSHSPVPSSQQPSNQALLYQHPVPLRPTLDSQQRRRQEQQMMSPSTQRNVITASVSVAPPPPPRQQQQPPPTLQRRQQQHYGNSNISDMDYRRVITESQAAHAAHTRRQVDDDIRFRRALEAAEMQSLNEDSSNGGGGGGNRQRQTPHRIYDDDAEFESQLERAIADSREASLGRQSQQQPQSDGGEDDLVRMISEQSIREEEERQRAAQEKYQLEMEMALRQSEYLEEENKRKRSSEEELLQQIIDQTRREQEEAQVAEQQMMQRVMSESVAAAESGGGVQEEELLEEVLKMSLEEKQRLARNAEEEAEQIRKAMEWSMYDFKCEEYDRRNTSQDR